MTKIDTLVIVIINPTDIEEMAVILYYIILEKPLSHLINSIE